MIAKLAAFYVIHISKKVTTLITIDLRKQQAFDADAKAIEQNTLLELLKI